VSDIRIEYDVAERTATAIVDDELIVIRAPEDYDPITDRGRWLVEQVNDMLNERNGTDNEIEYEGGSS
jgi:hypothetical protein